MNKSKTLGQIRHLLTFAGGYLVGKDFLDGDQLNNIIAGVITLVGLVWSYASPEKK